MRHGQGIAVMFPWLTRIFGQTKPTPRQRFFEALDILNHNVARGGVKIVECRIGALPLRSRTLVLGDPQYVPSLEISGFGVEQVTISAKIEQYSSGSFAVAELKMRAANAEADVPLRIIGELEIDSAKMVAADKTDLEKDWTDVGPDRIGVISTAPDNAVLKLLKQRFRFKTVQVNRVCAEVIGPISEETEQKVEAFLKSIPEYAKFPFAYFHVQTNNSFERVNAMQKPWDFLPIGNGITPKMFACETGRGDGVYGVFCGYRDDAPVDVRIRFIADE